MNAELRRLTDAVFYEGYVLWPYRRSAAKNAKRWTFGGVFPPRHNAAHPDDRGAIQAQCLVEGGDAGSRRARRRVLHVVRRELLDRDGAPVDELADGGRRLLAWDEATERELGPGDLEIPAGTDVERLPGGGSVVRSWRALSGTVTSGQSRCARASAASPSASRTRPRGTAATATTRCAARSAPRTPCCVRERGAFVSLTDPPDDLADEAAACDNVGVWPVLVGAEGERHTLLVVADHPPGPPADRAREPRRPLRRGRDRPAADPEHPLADAEEKDEMRGERPARRARSSSATAPSGRTSCCASTARSATSARASRDRLLERAGDGRDPTRRRRRRRDPRGEPRAAAPARRRRRLRPRARRPDRRRRRDRAGHGGPVHVAVTLDDDPGRDLGERALGHRFFFSPDEVEPLDGDAAAAAARVLVAGIGNVFLGDDGFGVELARRLARRELPAGVDVADFGIRGMDLAYALRTTTTPWSSLDAAPRGEPPGTLYVIEPELDGLTRRRSTRTAMDPVKVLALARALGGDAAARRSSLGCEPAVA